MSKCRNCGDGLKGGIFGIGGKCINPNCIDFCCEETIKVIEKKNIKLNPEIELIRKTMKVADELLGQPKEYFNVTGSIIITPPISSTWDNIGYLSGSIDMPDRPKPQRKEEIKTYKVSG